MNIQSVKPTLLIAVVEVALAVFLAYTKVYVPQQQEIQRIRAQGAQQRTNEQTAAEVAGYLEQSERYRTRLPAERDPAWLVRELVPLAQGAGVQVTTITQEDPQSFGPFTRLGVKLEVRASYHQLGTFLDAVEGADRFIRVDRIDIQPQGREGSPSVYLVFSTVTMPSLRSASGAEG